MSAMDQFHPEHEDARGAPLTALGRLNAQLGAIVYAVAWGVGGAILTAGTLYMTESRRRLRGPPKKTSPRESLMRHINMFSVARNVMEMAQGLAVGREYELRREYSERYGIDLDDPRGSPGGTDPDPESEQDLRHYIRVFADSVFANDALFTTLQEALGIERYTAWMTQLNIAQRKGTDQEAATIIIELMESSTTWLDDLASRAEVIGAFSDNQRALLRHIVSASQRLVGAPPKGEQH